ncbi:hypothetical protein TSMEX_004597 [Taenia solium]|eukprot:TsM_000978400 transcript=TsM_000978400 gene=TsM_000978400
MSIQQRDQEVDTLRCSLRRMSTEDLLHLHAYKFPLTQELKFTDLAQQMDLVEWIVAHQEQLEADFSNGIIFSGEAAHSHFDRLAADIIIGPFSFENVAGHAITFYDAGYRDVIFQFRLPTCGFNETVPHAIQPREPIQLPHELSPSCTAFLVSRSAPSDHGI